MDGRGQERQPELRRPYALHGTPCPLPPQEFPGIPVTFNLRSLILDLDLTYHPGHGISQVCCLSIFHMPALCGRIENCTIQLSLLCEGCPQTAGDLGTSANHAAFRGRHGAVKCQSWVLAQGRQCRRLQGGGITLTRILAR